MAEIRFIPADQRALLRALYRTRPCGICGKKEWCPHREPMVDLAEQEPPEQ